MSTPAQPQTLADALVNLNDAQRRAVTAPPGPVLVMAGPGTGKTQILTLRIAHRIAGGPDSDAIDPANVLCITFTEAGATAMRKRLRKLLGPTAYQITVRTYHGFANDVITANPLRFGRHREQRLIAPLEKRRIFRQLWADLPVNSPLKKLGLPSPMEMGGLEKLQENLAKDGLSPEALAEACKQEIAQLPLNPDLRYKKATKQGDGSTIPAGEPNPKKIAEATQKLERTLAAAELIAHYPAEKQKRGLFDFNDMLGWVVEAFAAQPELLADYQERYQCILVDEFQDSNGVQTQLLYQLLDNDAQGDRPDVFIVGDDDQSIYRFQGANLDNFNEFIRRYGDTLTFVGLEENYRSTQSVLDCAAALIDKDNPDRLIYNEQLKARFGALQKHLKSQHLYPEQQPRIREFARQTEEELWVIQEVESLLKAGVEPQKIAILSRKHEALNRMADTLHLRGVPCTRNRALNALEHPTGRAVVALMTHLTELNQLLSSHTETLPQADAALAQLLLLPLWGVPAAPLHILFSRYLQHSRARFANEQPPLPFLEWVLMQQPDELLEESFWKQVKGLVSDAADWSHKMGNWNVEQLLTHVLNTRGNLTEMLHSIEAGHHLPVLQALQGFFREWAERMPDLDTRGLLRLLQEVDEEDFQLDYTPLAGQDGGVVLTTLHGSKGLEYRHVFIIHSVKPVTPSNRFTLPEGFAKLQDTHAAADERRLLYVGLTRAEQGLTLTWAQQSEGKAKTAAPDPLLVELQPQPGWSYEVYQPDVAFTSALQELSSKQLLDSQALTVELLSPAHLHALLEGYRLTPTDLNAYLSCPRQFYYSRLLRVPSYRDDYLQYGNVVHKSLEEFFKTYQSELKENPEAKLPPASNLLDLFQRWMGYYRGLFSREQYSHYLNMGLDHLARYHAFREHTWVHDRNFWLEYPLEAEYDGVPLKGKIDKLVFTPTGTIVVDYKTGKPDEKKFHRPTDRNPEGGEYWRQLVFYHFLLADKPFQKGQIVVAGDYLQPKKEGSTFHFEYHTLEVNADDVRQLGQLITETWANLQALHFPTVSPELKDESDSPCQRCPLARVCWK